MLYKKGRSGSRLAGFLSRCHGFDSHTLHLYNKDTNFILKRENMTFVKELVKEREALRLRLLKVEELLKAYGEQFDENDSDSKKLNSEALVKSEDQSFPKESSYRDQILHVIKSKNRFMHVSEIANELKPYSDLDYGSLKRRISAVITKTKTEVDSLVNYSFSNSKKDTVWGKKDWLDENENIKEEFMYKDRNQSIKKKIVF